MVDEANSSQPELVGVATNVISGFLGAGKSTAILHLLQQKPENERWAVLVNEFGEVGIDGSLFQGREAEQRGVFVRELAGGCMCCASGMPMQITLASLLAVARPHRLLIEPTGLGHPREVLELLTSEHYRQMLDLRATITLVDARKIREDHYTAHPTFLQQLAVADLIVANKTDQYGEQDLPALRNFLSQTEGLDSKQLLEVEHGALQLDWLAHPAGQHDYGHSHARDPGQPDAQMPVAPTIPEAGFVRIDNEGEGFFSQGWIFDPSWTFDADKLYALLLGIEAERIKGVFRTNQGTTGYNMADGVMTQSSLSESQDSRVEVISVSQKSFVGLEQALLDCVISR